ncbi:MAG: SDR family NAD(P)-dependent oxidoreductase [Clostridia bacterium]|nr:SDR family NAD(P)-dependent oxidoreductase [Clostridia bacterium]
MKYVLVTGAYGGMGKALTKQLVDRGYYVFAMDKNIGEPCTNVCPIQTDITDLKSVENAFKVVRKKTDSLYAIIHLAGLYRLNSLVEIKEEEFIKAFNVNLFGAYRINKTFLPLLKKHSRIVITTSELAPLMPMPFTSVYSMTKSALDNYAMSLKMELQLLDIHVSILRPGAVETGLLNDSTDQLDKFCNNTALYSVNSKKFKNIVNKVESRKIKPIRIALKIEKILASKKPKLVYKINRNPLLLLLNVLPKRTQAWIIKRILKGK